MLRIKNGKLMAGRGG